MRLELSGNKVYIGDRSFMNNKFEELSKMKFCFEGVELEFVCTNNDNYIFFYDDSSAFLSLQKKIAENKLEVKKQLIRYADDYGINHELWKQLLRYTCEKYDINRYMYRNDFREFYGEYEYKLLPNDYYVYSTKNIICVDNLVEVYNMIESLLPQNLNKTLKLNHKKEIEQLFEPLKNIENVDFLESKEYLSFLETENITDINKWTNSYRELKDILFKIQIILANKMLESEYEDKIMAFFDSCFKYIDEKVCDLLVNQLVNKYGPVIEQKKRLRSCINNLKFMELVELYKDYKNEEELLHALGRKYENALKNSMIKQYLDVYRLGSVLISDKLNKLNKNKAKNKYISQELLDEAMLFYYDVDNIDEAYLEQSNDRYSQNKESGDIGERKVEYSLKWLNPSYIVIDKKSVDRVGKKCIYIANKDYIDEKQEFDHLIVSEKGVFNIETKNYSGKLVIDQYGNWIRIRDNIEEGIKNPLQQIRQHEKMLKSFLPSQCNVVSIICISNDKAIIEGSERCPFAIVKSDMLVEYIENYKSEIIISDEEKQEYIDCIYSHMI